LVAADGTVARWEDKSGNGWHATQATSGSRFQRKTGIKNGLDILRSTGDPKFMLSSIGINDIEAVTVFAVLTAANLADYQSAIRFQSSATGYFIYPWGSSALCISTPDGGTSGTSCGLVAGEWNVGSARRIKDSGTGLSTRRNESAVASVSTANANISSETTYLTIGRYDITPGEYFTGDLAEIFVFKSALSDPDIADLEAYLSTKWGI
jgi:hypothetical protein